MDKMTGYLCEHHGSPCEKFTVRSCTGAGNKYSVILLRCNKGVFFDRMENVEKFNLGGQSVAVVDYWQVVRPVPAVHCDYKAQI